jgi:excisionase family DNA binding protein
MDIDRIYLRTVRFVYSKTLTIHREEVGMAVMEQGVIEQELPLVMRVEDVQRVLLISRLKAYELVHRQGFPTVRIGRAIRIPRDAFLRWLDAQVGQDPA